MTHHVANPIRHHGHGPSENFTLILNDTVRDDRITANAFRVLALLLSHTDGWQESIREVAARYGWTPRTARAAFDQLCAERLLIVQKHLTAKGTRAYEVYHVHRSRRFTEAEVAEYGVTVTLVPNQHQGWCQNSTGGGAEMSPGVVPKQHHTEDHLEEQLEEQLEKQRLRLVSDPTTRSQPEKNHPRSHHVDEESPFTDGMDEENDWLADLIFRPTSLVLDRDPVEEHNRFVRWVQEQNNAG